MRRAWIVASLEPKLFCGVALWARSFLRAGKRWTHTIYATIIVNDRIAWSSNASTPTEPTGRCLLIQAVSPKRETIRIGLKSVKAPRDVLGASERTVGAALRGRP